jgi:polyisoprenoid-binding protein YceI
MKKRLLNIVTILAITAVFTSCKDNVKEAETTDEQMVEEIAMTADFNAVADKSMVMWKANKIVGGHEGTINLANGTANIKEDKLVGGKFVFDIKSLKCLDIPAEDEANAKLVGHLLSPDFFNAEVHDTATFEITNVENNNISGNLTLKGITKNVTFPANIKMDENEVNITSETFKIDRTEWNINYNSGKVMDSKALGDKMIKDDIELKIDVVAKKA